MGTGTPAAVGGDVDAGLTNQFGDFPSAVASNSDANQRTITSMAFANIPTASISAALVLTRTTLVAITVSGAWGAGAPGTPTNSGALGVALSGAFTEAASDLNSFRSVTPGLNYGSFTIWRVVPAGTLTATLQAHYVNASGIILRDHQVQLVAVRLA